MRLTAWLYTYRDLNVGYSSYNPKGTMIFIVGDNGSGSIVPGRADVGATLSLHIANLLMEVDPGVSLSLGQQFTLIDYAALGSYNRFDKARDKGLKLG